MGVVSVCGSPLSALSLVTLNGIIPCLAKGIASDLALAHSVGSGKEPDASCRFRLDECAGTRGDFMRLSQCIGCIGWLPGH